MTLHNITCSFNNKYVKPQLHVSYRNKQKTTRRNIFLESELQKKTQKQSLNHNTIQGGPRHGATDS